MEENSLKCPYCNILLVVPEKSFDLNQVPLRCKYCYGVFSFFPYDKRIAFNKSRNYYEIFGLKTNADFDSIKKRYRELAIKFHPDRHKDKELANEKMKHINYIYSILSSNVLRQHYDSALSFNEEFEDLFSNYEPPFYIYQESAEIVDATGRSVVIKRGDYIYFPVERHILIFGKKINLKKDYFGVKVQKIFNPKYKDNYEKVLGKKLEKDPLFCVNFGHDEMIIYKEDFQKIWISQKSLNKKDIRTVVVSSIIIAILISLGLMYLYNTHTWVVNDNGHMEVIKK